MSKRPNLGELRHQRNRIWQEMQDSEAEFRNRQAELRGRLEEVMRTIDGMVDAALLAEESAANVQVEMQAFFTYAAENNFTRNTATNSWNVLTGPDLALFAAQHIPGIAPPSHTMRIPLDYLLSVARVIKPRCGVRNYGDLSHKLIQGFVATLT